MRLTALSRTTGSGEDPSTDRRPHSAPDARFSNDGLPRWFKRRTYCNFAYSALASFRMGMSGSASFQRAKKSWYALFALAVSLERP